MDAKVAAHDLELVDRLAAHEHLVCTLDRLVAESKTNVCQCCGKPAAGTCEEPDTEPVGTTEPTDTAP